MENKNTLRIILLLIGIVIGVGAGYFLAPSKIETITETITVEEHPLKGRTIQIGCITQDGLEPKQTFYNEMIEKDINNYVEELGLDIHFEFVLKDAMGSDSTHLDKVQELNSEGINLFIGGSWTDMAQYSLEYVNMNNMLMVSDSSSYLDSSNGLPVAIEGDNLYRFCVTDFSQAIALVDIVYDFGIEYVYVFDEEKIGWSNVYYDAFKEKFEANGGKILGRNLDNDEAESLVGETIVLHGEEKVGIIMLVWMPSHRIHMVKDYPSLSSIYWFGYGEQGRNQDIIDESDGFQTQLRLFSPEASATSSGRWMEFAERYVKVVGKDPTYYEGTAYDAAWCIALTVIETGSTEASIVKEALPIVSANYYGVTGWCKLDKNGDRVPHISDIWGYALVDGEHTFLKYGEYNAQSRKTTWDYEVLAEQGIN
jgi:ABC-type branched-subunit amino acid transport system substrate-binding protein